MIMGPHLLLTVRLHRDGQGIARYHGVSQGSPEWPPSPARVFQALVAGSARGHLLSDVTRSALEWLERLPPPLIASPRARVGSRVDLFVPNNDADTRDDPRDVSEIRTSKVVHPMLVEDDAPLLYAWTATEDTTPAKVIIDAAEDLYQLGRGVDMAWAVGEVLDDDGLERRLRNYAGTIHRPSSGTTSKMLACPEPGSLVSLHERHRTTKLRAEGGKWFFKNAPKPRFRGVSYARTQRLILYDLIDRTDDKKSWPWPLHHTVKLVEKLRDAAVAKLREGLPESLTQIDQALIGRRADGSNPSPPQNRVRFIPLPSIGFEYADRAIRRVVIEIPSGAPLPAADLEWAFSGLEPAGGTAPFVLTRASDTGMLRHYEGPSFHWRSVTAIALPESAQRRRIEPMRRRKEAKDGRERAMEEKQAVTAVHEALRHAEVRATAVSVRVQREPFEGRGSRAEPFSEETRFAKERLWHLDIEFDRQVSGPLVIGDGRFLGLGLMSPVTAVRAALDSPRKPPVLTPPIERIGLFGLLVDDDARDDSFALAQALRRAVMSLAQQEIGKKPLPRFFSGHEETGEKAQDRLSNHIAMQWDVQRGRLLLVAPHWLDRREPTYEEREQIRTLDEVLDHLGELRAGVAGRFKVRRISLESDDDLLQASPSWVSLTPYTVTRHKKASATEVLIDDVLFQCQERNLPRPRVTVLSASGVPGRGLQGMVRLDFATAVAGPVVLGRTRYLGGGLFVPCGKNRRVPG